jgi:hypothetical protein
VHLVGFYAILSLMMHGTMNVKNSVQSSNYVIMRRIIVAKATVRNKGAQLKRQTGLNTVFPVHLCILHDKEHLFINIFLSKPKCINRLYLNQQFLIVQNNAS